MARHSVITLTRSNKCRSPTFLRTHVYEYIVHSYICIRPDVTRIPEWQMLELAIRANLACSIWAGLYCCQDGVWAVAVCWHWWSGHSWLRHSVSTNVYHSSEGAVWCCYATMMLVGRALRAIPRAAVGCWRRATPTGGGPTGTDYLVLTHCSAYICPKVALSHLFLIVYCRLSPQLCSTKISRADSTLTHVTMQMTQLCLNSTLCFSWLTQLRLNSNSNLANLTQLRLSSFESELGLTLNS